MYMCGICVYRHKLCKLTTDTGKSQIRKAIE